jgi:hypothetical protein
LPTIIHPSRSGSHSANNKVQVKMKHDNWKVAALQEERAAYSGSLMWESSFLLMFAALAYYAHAFAVVVPATWVGLLAFQTTSRLRQLDAQIKQHKGPGGFTIQDDYPPQATM